MPPKSKFTKEEIINAALNIVREEGFSALTARALGNRLGSSARPVFTVFESMEEVQHAVTAAARALYDKYIAKGLAEEQSFRGVGTQYICFAMKEPKLFQLLFMSEQGTHPNVSAVLPLIDENYEKILGSIEKDYGLNGAQAQNLYQHLWIYSHGIATLCATQMCSFTGEQIGEMMAEVCRGLLRLNLTRQGPPGQESASLSRNRKLV